MNDKEMSSEQIQDEMYKIIATLEEGTKIKRLIELKWLLSSSEYARGMDKGVEIMKQVHK